jgi:hypothetical protein
LGISELDQIMKRKQPNKPGKWLDEIQLAIADARETEPFGRLVGQLPTTGINHWVYLPDGRMFVGVELRNPQQIPIPDPLEPLDFELQRHMKHVHVGPYQALPQKWKDLKAELAVRGETIGSPSLEICGHHCDDASKMETTILIGLRTEPETATKSIDRTAFEFIYAGQPRWEIGRPQKAFLDVASSSKPNGNMP